MSDNQVKINSVRETHSLYNYQEFNQFMTEIFSDLLCKPQDEIFQYSLTSDNNKKLSFAGNSECNFYKEKTGNDPANLKEVFLLNKKPKLFINSDDSTSEIRSQLNDITQIYLPKITAHYGVKTLQELQEIDEANRKLLAINGDENSEAKDQAFDHFNKDQSIANQALGMITDNFLRSVKPQNNSITTNPDLEQLNSLDSLPSMHVKTTELATSLKRISSIIKG